MGENSRQNLSPILYEWSASVPACNERRLREQALILLNINYANVFASSRTHCKRDACAPVIVTELNYFILLRSFNSFQIKYSSTTMSGGLIIKRMNKS